MKGDFSSMAFADRQQYSRVLMQQGRVQLDSDWNTQAEIIAATQRQMARALFGHAGAPADNAGFGIRLRHGLRFCPGSSVRIDGAQAFAFDMRAPFTLEAWVLPEGPGTVMGNLDRSAQAPAGGYALSVGADGALRFECLHAGAHGQNVLFHHDSWRALPFGRVSHVGACGDGERIALYLDGELVGEHALPAGTAEASHPLRLGAVLRDGHIVDSLHGTLYMAAVWSRALTAAQLQASGRHHRHGPHADLLGAWCFDEDGGARVADASGRGHEGWLSGHGHQHDAAAPRQPSRAPSPLRTGREAWIESGLFYVDGIACELRTPLPVAAQPDLPGVAPPDLDSGDHLVYLDVWERYLSAAEAPAIAEPALAGADTTGRVVTVRQVRIGSKAELAERRHCADGRLRMRAALTPGAPAQDNRLVRIELHHGGALAGSEPTLADSHLIVHSHLDQGALVLETWQRHMADWRPGQPLELFHGEQRVAAVLLDSDAASRTLYLAHLPHEVRHWRVRTLASVKWARDNGSLCYAVDAIDGAVVTLAYHEQGPAPLQLDDLVELSNDALVLRGLPGVLCTVVSSSIGADGLTQLELLAEDGVLPAAPGIAGAGALLRRWDRNGPADPVSQLAPCAQSLIVADRIEIGFQGDGVGRSGDYWTVTLRDGSMRLGGAECDDQSDWMASRGVRHHYAELALLHCDDAQPWVEDLRRSLSPLGDQAPHSGGKIRGPLAVEGTLSVAGAARFDGKVEVERLHGRLAHGMVGHRQLREHAVTQVKLHPEVGTVPAGFAILGASQEAPPGYYYGGTQVVTQGGGAWQAADAPPRDDGGTADHRCHLVATGHGLFALFEHTGELWERRAGHAGHAQWQRRAPLPAPRRHRLAVAFAEHGLFAIGGRDHNGVRSDRNMRYDIDRDTWEERALLPLARSDLAVATLDGQIHVVGGKQASAQGWRRNRLSDRHDCYVVALDRWITLPSLPNPAFGMAMAACQGELHVMGGVRGPSLPGLGERTSHTHHVYNPRTSQWRDLAQLPLALRYGAACTVDDHLYLAGGIDAEDATIRAMFVFDAETGQWRRQGGMQAARSGFGMAHWRGTLWAVGGGASVAPRAEHCQLAGTMFVHIKRDADHSLGDAAGLPDAPAIDEAITPGVFLEHANGPTMLGSLAPRPVSPQGRAFIEQNEAWRSHPYKDAAGYYTIGYGHLLTESQCNGSGEPDMRNGISREQGDQLLAEDLHLAEKVVTEKVTTPLNDAQYAALCDFVYNVGSGHFASSTLLKAVNQRRFDRVAPELRRWTLAHGKPIRGLVARREREIALFFADQPALVTEAAMGEIVAPLDIRTGQAAPEPRFSEN